METGKRFLDTNPNFYDEKFDLKVKDPFSDEIQFLVYDSEVFQKDRIMGRCSFSVQELLHTPIINRRQITLESAKSGWIKISVALKEVGRAMTPIASLKSKTSKTTAETETTSNTSNKEEAMQMEDVIEDL